MKKMIIAAITVLAVIATVIGCQVYDSQTNETIYSSMNALGEGSMSKEDYIAKFTNDCRRFIAVTDLSSDEAKNTFETFIGYYFSYPTFYTTVKTVLSNETGFTGDASNDLNNPTNVIDWYKNNKLDIKKLQKNVKKKEQKIDSQTGEVETPAQFEEYEIEGLSISALYDKQYQQKWDWNSKKGR